MYLIIAYDLSNTRRRTRLAKLLQNYARRMQYSVFEGELNADQFHELIGKIHSVIKPKKDSVRIYRLCTTCKQKTVIFGPGDLYEDPEVIII